MADLQNCPPGVLGVLGVDRGSLLMQTLSKSTKVFKDCSQSESQLFLPEGIGIEWTSNSNESVVFNLKPERCRQVMVQEQEAGSCSNSDGVHSHRLLRIVPNNPIN